jgi:hypothetical protein
MTPIRKIIASRIMEAKRSIPNQDSRRCIIDFNRVRCKQDGEENCLTAHQVEIARQIYEGPRRADGSQIAASSAVPGSELTREDCCSPIKAGTTPWAHRAKTSTSTRWSSVSWAGRRRRSISISYS